MRALAVTASVLLLLACGSAYAQTSPVTVEALTPRGLVLIDVDVPDVAAAPVRLRFAPEGQARAEVLVDVMVEPSAPTASEAAAWFRQTVSGELPLLDGLGDAAAGDAGLVAFVRGRVFVVVRRVTGTHDVRGIASSIDARLRGAREGSVAPVRVSVASPQVGASASVEAPGALAVHVTTTGPAVARRTPTGWVIARTGAGPIDVSVFHVSHGLTRGRTDLRLP